MGKQHVAPQGTALSGEVIDIIAKLKKRKREEVVEKGGEKKRRESQIDETINEEKRRESRIDETISEEKKQKKQKKDKKSKKSQPEVESTPEAIGVAVENTPHSPQTTPSKKHHKKEKKQNLEEDPLSKHKSIHQKLSRVKTKALKPPPAPEPAPSLAPITPVGLQPLPQPPPTKPPKHSVTLASALPPWLASPTTVTPTATLPFTSIPGLSPKLLSRLSTLSLTHAFAVQSAVIPLLLSPTSHDVCISAATGSGKTLSYILPIINSLSTRTVTRLRAIIIVPTRELVSQVFTTTSSLTPNTGLKVATAIGNRALAVEQSLLVGPSEDGLVSKVDILITTPGRLVEHIKNTPGFSLRSVKWLVIDEADRLLAQSFQEWVEVVVSAVEAIDVEAEYAGLATVLEDLGIRIKTRNEVRKVVLSATMTRDAGKLAGLKLRRPTMVVVENEKEEKKEVRDDDEDDDDMPDEIFSVPWELKEYAIPIANTEYKPLHLMYLLRDRGIKSGTVVFVKSNEGAARLAHLIDTLVARIPLEAGVWTTGLITGEMEKKRREKVLKAFKRGEVQMIIASDLISRGLDLPHVEHIVNYDIPASTRAYVHRVGRTARAGKEGEAFTLVADKEARWFWRNVGRGIRREGAIERMAVGLEEEGLGWRGVYEGVLYG